MRGDRELNLRTRLALRIMLHQAGFNFREVNRAMFACDDDMIGTVAEGYASLSVVVAAVAAGVRPKGVIGDWLRGPDGQAFLSELFKLLLDLLRGVIGGLQVTEMVAAILAAVGTSA